MTTPSSSLLRVECFTLAESLEASINLMPLSIWKKLSLLELTPTQMILELADRSTTSPFGIAKDVFVNSRNSIISVPTSVRIDEYDFDPKETFFYYDEDPSLILPLMKNHDLKQVDVTLTKPSVEEPPELELKDLPSHLEYAFLEGTDKLPIIVSKELKD
ncbi:hypothetical protein Tco_0250723 [Tanacetum coccineum]